MKKILVFLTMLILVLSLVSIFVIAKANSDVITFSRYSLLKDRLFVSMPKGCDLKNLSDGNALKAQTSNERETSITYKVGSEELVLYARELFCYSKSNLLKDVNTILDIDPDDPFFTLQSTKTTDGLAMILVKPTVILSTDDGTFVSGAIVRQQDGSLISIYTYVNEAAYEKQLNYSNLSDQIIKSIKKGTKPLVISKRNIIIDGNLQITVQNGYASFVEAGKDYNVYSFVKIITVGGYWSNMGIYSGENPEYIEPLSDSITQDGKILGQNVKWVYNYANAKDPNAKILVETMAKLSLKNVKTGKIYKRSYDIFLDSNLEKELENMKKMASTLKFVNSAK